VLNSIASGIPSLIGGSADLTGSNKTWLDDAGIFTSDNYGGKNIHFGVREHAMGAALNGMSLHSGVIPYGGTFLIFSDYCRPAIRIAALSNIPATYVFTHDSIGLGEDGPTHQPIEHLASLRAIPNVQVLRPADANETAWAWKAALEFREGPSLLVLTRQALPVLQRGDKNDASLTMKGAYIISDSQKETPDAILMATGSEVQLALKANQKLKKEQIDARVVSMPSWELFAQQDQAYRDKVLPPEVKARVSVEAAAPFGWERWIGSTGTAIGLDRFGASAPYEEIYEHLGITEQRIVDETKELL
jgi:transketolase